MTVLDVVDQHCERAGFLWFLRSNAVRKPHFRLIDLVRLDGRLEANVDGLRVAGPAGHALALAALDDSGPGAFFAAAVVAIESNDVAVFDGLVERALVAAENNEAEPYEPVNHIWRGLVSALAWVDQPRATRIIRRLFQGLQPRMHWLAIAVCGARRSMDHAGLETALAHASPLVRARAYRTAGQLGRADLVAQLRPGLTDDDPECRFWSAWAAARMGARGEALDVLADIAWNNHPRAVRALDLLAPPPRCSPGQRLAARVRQASRPPARPDPRCRRDRRPALHPLADRAHGRAGNHQARRRGVFDDHRRRPRLSRPRSQAAAGLRVRP